MRLALLLFPLIAHADVSAPAASTTRESSCLITANHHVYWSEYDSDTNRSRVVTTNGRLGQVEGQIEALAADADAIYALVQRDNADVGGWTHPHDVISLSHGRETILAARQPIADDQLELAADAHTLHFISRESLYRVSKRGGPVVRVANDLPSASGLISDGRRLFFSSAGTLWMADRGRVQFVDGGVEGDFFGRLAVEGDRVFLAELGEMRWHSWVDGRVFVFDPRTGWLRPVARNLHGPSNLVANGGRVYWSTYDQQIQSVSFPSEEVKTLATTVDSSVELAAADGVLYWLDQGSLRHLDISRASDVDTMAATSR